MFENLSFPYPVSFKNIKVRAMALDQSQFLKIFNNGSSLECTQELLKGVIYLKFLNALFLILEEPL